MEISSSAPYRKILGVNFFTGTAPEAVSLAMEGGLVVAPSAPVLCAMATDPATHKALLNCDVAITDSGLMILLWYLMKRDHIRRVSGLEYMQLLVKEPSVRALHGTLWVMPAEQAMERNIAWLQQNGHAVSKENCYLAPHYRPGAICDEALLARINAAQPPHIIMAIGGGVQEKLGYYLKQNANYRPSIHCTGAAIGFLSGDQTNIPSWADKYFLGWLMRCFSSPGKFIPRYWNARKLVSLMLKYRELEPVCLQSAK